MKQWFVFFSALILLLAAILRLPILDRLPATQYIDEVAMLVDARSVAERGSDMHGNPWYQTIFPSYGDYKLPVYIWSAAGLMQLFGTESWVIRLPSALAGVGSVILSIFLAYRLGALMHLQSKDRSVFALMAGLSIALAPWSILFSRTAFEGHLAQFFLLASILALTYWPKWWGIAVSLIAGVLATYTYFSVLYVWIGCLALFALYFVISGFKKRTGLKGVVTGALIAAVMLLLYWLLILPLTTNPLFEPMRQFRLSTPSLLNSDAHILKANEYRQLSGNTVLSRVLFHRELFRLQQLAEHVSSHLTFDYLYLSGDPYLRHSTGRHGLFLWPFAIFLVVGLYELFRRYPLLGFALVGWWGLALIPAAMTFEVPHALRSINALPVLTILHGFGGMICVRWLSNQPNQIVRMGVLAAALAMLSYALIEFSWYYSRMYYPATAEVYWNAREQQVVQALNASLPPDTQLYVQGQSEMLYLWYMAEHPEWYESEVVREGYQIKRVGSFADVSLLQSQTSDTIYVLARQSYLDQLVSEGLWEVETSKSLPGTKDFGLVALHRNASYAQ